MLRILATMAPSTAASMSASSKTMHRRVAAQLHRRRHDLSAAERSNLRPTSVEPVKLIDPHARIMQQVVDQRAGFLSTADTLTTPFGTPASSNSGISSSMVSGVSEAGLMMTGQPAASAGAILRVPMAAGKFQRRHQHGNAGGLVLDHDPGAGGGGAETAHRRERLLPRTSGRIRRRRPPRPWRRRAPCRFPA